MKYFNIMMLGLVLSLTLQLKPAVFFFEDADNRQSPVEIPDEVMENFPAMHEYLFPTYTIFEIPWEADDKPGFINSCITRNPNISFATFIHNFKILIQIAQDTDHELFNWQLVPSNYELALVASALGYNLEFPRAQLNQLWPFFFYHTSVCEYSSLDDSLSAVCFSKDCNFALTIWPNTDNKATLWDLRNKQHPKSEILDDVRCAALSSDGRYALTWGFKTHPMVNLLDLKEKAILSSIEVLEPNDPSAKPSVMAFSDDANSAIIGLSNGRLRIVNLEDKFQLKAYRLSAGACSNVNAVAFSPDARYALYCDYDHVGLYDRVRSRIEWLETPCRGANCVAFSPDGNYGFVGTICNPYALIFDLSDKSNPVAVSDLITDSTSRLGASAATFSYNGEYLILNKSGAIELWDVLDKKQPNLVAKCEGPRSRTLLFGSNDSFVLSGSSNCITMLPGLAPWKNLTVHQIGFLLDLVNLEDRASLIEKHPEIIRELPEAIRNHLDPQAIDDDLQTISMEANATHEASATAVPIWKECVLF